MSRSRILIIVAVVVVVAAGFIYTRVHKKTGAVTYRTATVAKGTLVATVSGTGNVVVNNSAKVNPSISGTVTSVKVGLGDVVKKGQTLFTISNDQLDIAVQKSNTSYVQAKQQLVNAQASLAQAKQTYSGQVGTAGINKAQATLDQANLTLVKDQSQLSMDQSALNASPSDTVLQQKVVADQSTITNDQTAVTSAQTALDQMKAGTGPAVQNAKAQLSAAQTSVQVAQQGVTSAAADLDSQKKSAAERTVTAPIDGTISTLSVSVGDTLGGSSASSSSAASSSAPVAIQDLTTLKAVIQINEVDIASVAVGQKASMTFDAISGLTLTGKVEKVDTVGTATQGVVTYSATIGFDALDAKVRPEMSVNAVITTQVKQDVLSVASTAVKSQSDGTSYVQVMENGTPRNQTVTTGIASDTDTEIVSGLTEGQTVVTQTITATTTNTNTSSTRGGGGFQGLGGGGATRVIGGFGG